MAPKPDLTYILVLLLRLLLLLLLLLCLFFKAPAKKSSPFALAIYLNNKENTEDDDKDKKVCKGRLNVSVWRQPVVGHAGGMAVWVKRPVLKQVRREEMIMMMTIKDISLCVYVQCI